MIIGIPDHQIDGDPTTGFKYVIREYDKVNKHLIVDYDDGTWAKINLYEPLPATRRELEAYIRQYTDPIERELAKNDETDMSFIENMVGKEFETGRRWMLPPPKPAPEPVAPEDVEIVDDIIDEEIGGQQIDPYGVSAEVMKLSQYLSQMSYLFVPGVFEALTEESQRSVKAARDDAVRQLRQAYAALQSSQRFEAEILGPEIKFESEVK